MGGTVLRMPKTVLAGAATAHIAATFRERAGQMGDAASLRAIQRHVGISPETVRRAFSGTSGIPVSSFIGICDALGLDPAKLIAEAAVVYRSQRRDVDPGATSV